MDAWSPAFVVAGNGVCDGDGRVFRIDRPRQVAEKALDQGHEGRSQGQVRTLAVHGVRDGRDVAAV